MYTSNRDAYRQFFFTVWQKHEKNFCLIQWKHVFWILFCSINIIPCSQKPDAYTQQEFALEENPFFHMSLHLGLREQIETNRPAGIRMIHQQLSAQHPDPHQLEHLMMECLCSMMSRAEQNDEAYLGLLQNIPA